MIQPTKAQISAGIAEARSELTAISGFINYNNMISDDQMLSFMMKVAVAILNTPAPKGHV
jgi:hypothetical protein